MVKPGAQTSGIHQGRYECQVTGQAVELGNDELGFLLFAGREGLHQLRPVIALATLDFGEFINQRPPAAVQVAHDRFALRGEAETGFALAICAGAEISDELAVMRWH